MVLRCPFCKRNEILRRKVGNDKIFVFFECGFAAVLPDQEDNKNQTVLDSAYNSNCPQ